MNELTFLLCDRPARASVERDRELVVLRIGRKRLTFPVRAVPALVKMLAETALDEHEREPYAVPTRPQPGGPSEDGN